MKDRASEWSVLRHPTERGEGRGRFDLAAEFVSNVASGPLFFTACLLLALAWAIGLVVGFSLALESHLIGAMAAVTLLLVALLKNSERRAERAMQLKLDAIAAAILKDRTGELDDGAEEELEDAVRLHDKI